MCFNININNLCKKKKKKRKIGFTVINLFQMTSKILYEVKIAQFVSC